MYLDSERDGNSFPTSGIVLSLLQVDDVSRFCSESISESHCVVVSLSVGNEPGVLTKVYDGMFFCIFSCIFISQRS